MKQEASIRKVHSSKLIIWCYIIPFSIFRSFNLKIVTLLVKFLNYVTFCF